MPAREQSAGSGGSALAPTSRRTFLVGACSVGGLGLAAGPATGDGTAVTVATSPAQREAAREAVDTLEDARPDASVSLDVVETSTGLDRFAEGAVDVLAGSRPMLPDERSLAAERGVEYVRREVPTATAVLRQPGSTWLHPLRPRRLAETWADDGVVETWAEVTTHTTDRGATRRPAANGPSPAPATDGDSGAGPASSGATPVPGGTVLVRGPRASQYASGFGGVAYYEPEVDWLRDSAGSADADSTSADAEFTAADADATPDDVAATSATPVVRLGYLYAAESSLRHDAVAEVVRTYVHRSVERVGNLAYYAEPIEAIRDR